MFEFKRQWVGMAKTPGTTFTATKKDNAGEEPPLDMEIAPGIKCGFCDNYKILTDYKHS